MFEDFIGVPQIAAIAVLIQRGAEEIHSTRNTKRIMAAGGREEGREYYPVVALAHIGWIGGIFFLIPADAAIVWPLLGIFLVVQLARYWVIATLGRYWTHRIITLDDAPIIQRGPYKLVRHPNYAVTYAETFLLPAAFGALAFGIIMTGIWIAVIRYKILLEDRAIDHRRQLNLSAGG